MSNDVDRTVDPPDVVADAGDAPMNAKGLAGKLVQSLSDKAEAAAAGNADLDPDPVKPDDNVADPPVDDSLIPSDLLGEDSEEDEDEEPIPEPEGMSESAAAAFKIMREKLNALEAAQKATDDVTPSADVEALQAELAEARSQIAAQDLTKDPLFIDRYLKPRQAVGDEIQSTIKAFGGDADLAQQLVRLDMKGRVTLLNEKLPDAVAILGTQLATYDTRTRMANEALQNHRATRQSLASQKMADNQRLTEQSFDSALMELKGAGHHLLHESTANEEWTKSTRQRVDSARELMKAENPQDRARIALLASTADGYRQLVDQQQTLIKQLKAQVGKSRKKGPDLGQSGSPAPAAGAPAKGDANRPKSGKQLGKWFTDGLNAKAAAKS